MYENAAMKVSPRTLPESTRWGNHQVTLNRRIVGRAFKESPFVSGLRSPGPLPVSRFLGAGIYTRTSVARVRGRYGCRALGLCRTWSSTA